MDLPKRDPKAGAQDRRLRLPPWYDFVAAHRFSAPASMMEDLRLARARSSRPDSFGAESEDKTPAIVAAIYDWSSHAPRFARPVPPSRPRREHRPMRGCEAAPRAVREGRAGRVVGPGSRNLQARCNG